MARDAQNALFDREAEQLAAMLRASRIDVSGDVPGFESVATAIGTRCLRNSATGGAWRSRRV